MSDLQGTRSVLQPKAEGVGRAWTRRAGHRPVRGGKPRAIHGESIRLSMPEHRPTTSPHAFPEEPQFIDLGRVDTGVG
jgi:hypothetical protein